ncbi:MAG TPA: maleylacetoacetate isomerase [Novosphingobium sp.]|nr:maleylacetoacetate isomerase [Novosphingobium sp.]HQE00677.1 maleylacetoacetate isomerase [Novosphingobium sp.]
MSGEIVLYDYWRSSAAYRVRIALNLKGISYRSVPVDLSLGEQGGADYLARNPQGLIPALEIDGNLLTQSLAIIDYLDATRPTPPIAPADPALRSSDIARALVIAADIHPIQNLRVMNRLKSQFGAAQEQAVEWNRHWISLGFAALEADAPEDGLFGGDSPSLADICLVPQMANARRFETPLDDYPRLVRIDSQLRALPAFAAAAPDAVRPA